MTTLFEHSTRSSLATNPSELFLLLAKKGPPAAPPCAVKVVQRLRVKETDTDTSEAYVRSLVGAVMLMGGQDTFGEIQCR